MFLIPAWPYSHRAALLERMPVLAKDGSTVESSSLQNGEIEEEQKPPPLTLEVCERERERERHQCLP